MKKEKDVAKEKKLKPKKPKPLFRLYKAFIKLFKTKINFYYVDKKVPEGALILSNHESTKGPFAWELYYEEKVRMMGAAEMNSGFRRMYKYQTKVYYHQKKHWNLFLARIFCLLATPLTYFFYKGLQLISIKDGFALKTTIADANKALIEFKERVVIFPEDSSEGYFKKLKSFKHGFLLVLEQAYKNGYDIPVAVAYVKLEESTCLIDNSVKYSELLEKYKTRDEIAKALCDRCNELGVLDHTQFNKEGND